MRTQLFDMRKSIQRQRCSRHGWRGFTLIELLVVVGIVLAITALLLVSQGRFSGNILLTNAAYDVALSIRQAQVFGLGAREAGIQTAEFDTGYGIHFDTSNRSTYILFADRNRDFKYEGAGELIQTFSLGRGFYIEEFCGGLSGGVEECSSGSIDEITIVFDRPEPDAIIKNNVTGKTYGSARIMVRSPQGTGREVTAVATGQISVATEPVEDDSSGSSDDGDSSGGITSSDSGGNCSLIDADNSLSRFERLIKKASCILCREFGIGC